MVHETKQQQSAGRDFLEHDVFGFLNLRFRLLTVRIVAFVDSNHMYSKQYAITLQGSYKKVVKIAP
jgi:hypothetical protein